MIGRLKGSPFFKAILLLSSGAIIAQGIRAIATPVLTRIYSPETMGIYTYLISISGIFMGVANLRYEIAIVTDTDDKNVFPLIKLSTLIGLVVSIISAIGFGVYFNFSGKPFLWSVLLLFNVLAYAFVNVLTAFNNRNKEYGLISSMYIVRTATQYVLAIVLGLFCPIAWCLLIPYVLGEYFGISRQLKSLKSHISDIVEIPMQKLKKVAIVHKKQPLFSTPALLANSLSYSLITIFIESLFGLETVGFYSISVTLLGLPLAVIGGNVSKVFVQRASTEFALYGTYKHTFNKTFLVLFVLAIPMVIFMYFFATPLCEIIFGREWSKSGVYIMILAPMFGVRFITSALSPAFTIVKKQQIDLFLQGLFLLSNLISFFVTKAMNLTVEGFLTIVSVSFTLAYILYLVYIYIYSRRKVPILL